MMGDAFAFLQSYRPFLDLLVSPPAAMHHVGPCMLRAAWHEERCIPFLVQVASAEQPTAVSCARASLLSLCTGRASLPACQASWCMVCVCTARYSCVNGVLPCCRRWPSSCCVTMHTARPRGTVSHAARYAAYPMLHGIPLGTGSRTAWHPTRHGYPARHGIPHGMASHPARYSARHGIPQHARHSPSRRRVPSGVARGG